MPVNARDGARTSRDKQGQAGISKDKAGTGRNKAGTIRDKQGHYISVPAYPYMSLSVPVCPCLTLLFLVRLCLSLSVLVCPCLSLYVSTFTVPSCLPLQMNISVFISIHIVTLNFLAKATVPMHANHIFNSYFTFHLAPQ